MEWTLANVRFSSFWRRDTGKRLRSYDRAGLGFCGPFCFQSMAHILYMSHFVFGLLNGASLYGLDSLNSLEDLGLRIVI